MGKCCRGYFKALVKLIEAGDFGPGKIHYLEMLSLLAVGGFRFLKLKITLQQAAVRLRRIPRKEF